MVKYSLAFIFNPSLNKVLLIEKNRPEWQRGKLNGIGGHVEEGETAIQCIQREVLEESNLNIPGDKFLYCCEIQSTDWSCSVFATISHNKAFKSLTDEQINWFIIKKLPINIISNLSWLIPLCIDKLNDKDLKEVNVKYQ